ncbi:hypothetical protein PSFL6913_30000 [Pseudomonas fluorescens]
MLAASHTLNCGGDGLITVIDIVRRNGCNCTARLIHTDGNGLAVIQSHGQRVGDVSHCRAVFIHKAGGVNDIAAFTNSGIGSQNHINFIDGVVDRGGRTVTSNFQLLEITASGVSDLDRLSALVDEHVIAWRWDSHSTDGVAGLDGDS